MYPGPERYDVQVTVKGVAPVLQAPTRLSMARLRRLVLDLCGTLQIGMFHMHQDEEAELTVWADGDRSGDVQTCKSTSSGAMLIGARDVECQPGGCVALLGRERIFRHRQRHNQRPHRQARVPGGFGQHQARSKDTDGGENRHGRGQVHVAQSGLRASHLATRCLWHQDALKDGLFEAERCASKDNPADVGTKALDKEAMKRLLGVLCIVSRAATGYASTEGQRVLAALLPWPGLVFKARGRDAGQC